MITRDTIVSVVVPVADLGERLEQVATEALAVLAQHYNNFELLFVASTADEQVRPLVTRLMQQYAGVRLVMLADTSSAHGMVLAGMESVVGDYTVMLTSDSDPVADIPAMVKLAAQTGAAILGVPKIAPRASVMYGAIHAAACWSLSRLLGIKLPGLSTGFCVFPRAILNAAARSRSRGDYLRMLSCAEGLPAKIYSYVPRPSGETRKPSPLKLLDDCIALVVSHSKAPLRIVSALGIMASILNLVYVLYVAAICLFKKDVAPGWTTLSLQTAFMFFFVFLNFVLIAEYLANSLDRGRDRPLYHVLEELSNPLWLSGDGSRRNLSDGASGPHFQQPAGEAFSGTSAPSAGHGSPRDMFAR